MSSLCVTSALVVAACTAIPGGGVAAPGASASSVPTGPQTSVDTPLPAEGLTHHPDGRAVTSEPQSVLENGLGQHISVTWPHVKGATALNTLLDSWAATAVHRFRRDAPPSDVSPHELHVAAVVAEQVGAIVHVELQVYESVSGARGAESSVGFWSDPTTDDAWTSDELVRPGQRSVLAARVIAALAAKRGTVPQPLPTEGGKLDEVAAGVRFAPGGALRVRLDAGVLGTVAEGIRQVEVGGDPAVLLNDAGRRVRAAWLALGKGGPGGHRPTTPAPATATRPPVSRPSAGTMPAPSQPAPEQRVDCTKAKCIALTFDDGPGRHTGSLLDVLEAKRVRATFFVLGQNAVVYPTVMRRMHSLGMVIGNHTWDHGNLTRMTPSQQLNEVGRTADAIEHLGLPRPTLLRPPYGAYNSTTKRLGLPLILWDVDTLDWQNRDTEITTKRALDAARPGSIILLHDIHYTSVRAVPGIIDALRAKGYVFVTVPELVKTRPGRVYARR